MATALEERSVPLDSTSEPPSLFDGTTRLYINYECPFAQRVWIARNYKGLQDKNKLVPINLANRPTWYKEKVYPGNKVPSLEHENKVVGESLDLLKYIEDHFEGPKLLPENCRILPKKSSRTDKFNGTVYTAFKGGDPMKEAGSAFDYLEAALHKFDGPFFLCGLSLVDFAYAPFVERFHIFIQDVWKHDITSGRRKLATWIEELNKINAYRQTKCDLNIIPKYKSYFLV